MANVNVDTTQFRDKVAQLKSRIPELIDNRILGPELVRRMKARFDTKIAPDGSRWKARSAKTKSGGSLLLRSGTLRDAIDVIQGRPPGYASNTGLGFRIGLTSKPYTESWATGSRIVDPLKYGRAHQMGDGYVPKRRFIGMSEVDRQWALATIRSALASAVK